ncbi:MAG TPA: LacI family DNA-binding transcriptional regulator [Burkholderiales bacterium]|jgi:DNA-binding LacI/PurR family transcriptional regulator|nr:LacI family DNA-binding transcriptional regulator [Steroidobacteraceae bacterium]HWP90052.1 LacI family DNA-binding transcriptional regulator [Burkholderiales bacterium]
MRPTKEEGNGSVTLEKLARLAKVSISTVSRALNDHPSISSSTKKQLWALARKHGYEFRRHMPASPIGAEGAVTIVTPRVRGRPLPLSHPFFLELLASIGEAARDRGCDFTVSHLTPANYEDLVHATTTGRANGVIFLGQGTLHEEFNRLARTESRFVVWGAQIPGQKYCTIGTDNMLGGKRATQHLLKLGRRRLLFLGGSDPEATQRYRGYAEALQDAGIPIDDTLIGRVEFEAESAEAAVDTLVRRKVRFDGIVAASDLIALGAIRALHRSSIAVPQDVSVVGYDNNLLSRLSTPTLSTVQQDIPKAGRMLVSKLLEWSGDTRPELLSTELIIRESCGA